MYDFICIKSKNKQNNFNSGSQNSDYFGRRWGVVLGRRYDYYRTQVRVPDAKWGQIVLKYQSLEQRKFYCRAMQGEQVAHAQNKNKNKNPNYSLKGFSKAFLKARWGRGIPG